MKFNLDSKTKRLITALSIIIGTVVGAGFLGLPYVAAKSGFLVTLGYLIILGILILFVNLYFGEIILRTKGEHHLVGFAYRYLGKKGKDIMFVLVVLSIFSALLAYMIGVGASLSVLFFGNTSHEVILGALFGFFMSYLLWGSIRSFRKYERMGIGALTILFILMILFYSKDVSMSNLLTFDKTYLFFPLGVVLFSLIEFFSLPAVRTVLNKNETVMKKAIILGTVIPMIFYAFFAFLVVGFAGSATPEVSTLAFGPLFIVLGIVTMFTSYLALGTALKRSFMLDYREKKKVAWFKSAIVPIMVFLLLELFDFFSFTNVISIGGIFAGGLIVVMILVIHRKANVQGNRIPEYQVYLSKIVAVLISALFIAGIVMEVLKYIG